VREISPGSPLHTEEGSSARSIHCIQHCRMAGGSLRQMGSFQGPVVYSRSALRRLYEHPPSSGGPKVLAAIPCLNEEISIGSVVLQTRKYVDEVMVVDDGSRDETARLAEEAGATVIRHRKNLGKAAGVKTALRYALDHPFDLIILLDGDGQHKPEEIPSLTRPVIGDEADLVIGSRFLDGNNGSVPVYRRLGQTILTMLTNASSTQKTTDSQSGFRALNRRAMESLTVESEGYNIESDMISHLSQKGIRIQETPITAIYDVPNKHKKNPFYHGYDIVATMVGEIGYKRPMLLFGMTGGFLVLVSLVLGSYAFTIFSLTNMLPFGFTIASGIALILGMLLIVAGLILNSLVLIMSRK
jgi:glycosyltransferase involved in cell wall biosynthesis